MMTAVLPMSRVRSDANPFHATWLRPVLLLCLLLLWLASLPQVQAQDCWATSFTVDFDTVSTSANTDVAGTLPFICQATGSTTSFTVCLFIPAGGQSLGVNPRRMINFSTSQYLNYNLYSDPARTQIIGPPPTGGGYTVYSQSFTIPGGNQQQNRTFTVYGRVPAVPNGTAAGAFQEQNDGIVLRYARNQSSTPPSDCFQNPNNNATVGFQGVHATVPSGCSIAIAQASDLDFGSVSTLASPLTGLSSISLNCPSNTSWRLGLSNGSHALVGQRRMAGPSSNFVEYELYRDAGRTQRWGNDTAGGSDVVSGSGAGQSNPTVVPVYGRVPAQPSVVPGSYSDTITVTLTY